MAFDAFMKIEGVEGESTAAGHTGEIEIYSFSLGASNPSDVGAGRTGLAASRVSLSSFNVMKKTDKASATLFLKCCQGKHLDSIVVTMRKAGGDAGQKAFLTYTFTDCLVDSIQWSGSSGGDDVPTESVAFAYAQVNIEYQQQDTKGGSVGKPVSGGWDITKVEKK